MDPFTSETGRWRFAPAEERAKAAAAVRSEQDARAGEALYRLSTTIDEAEATVTAAIDEAAAAPSAEAAWQAANSQIGLTKPEMLSLAILDELTGQRIDRQLAGARPSQVLAQWTQAQKQPHRQDNAAVIREIERRTTTGRWDWPADAAGDNTELTSTRALQKAVSDARDARIPASAKAAREAVQKARALKQRAADVYQLSPRRPEGKG